MIIIFHQPVCDLCGEKGTIVETGDWRLHDELRPPAIPYAEGWHLLDAKLVCPRHTVLVESVGSTTTPLTGEGS